MIMQKQIKTKRKSTYKSIPTTIKCKQEKRKKRKQRKMTLLHCNYRSIISKTEIWDIFSCKRKINKNKKK